MALQSALSLLPPTIQQQVRSPPNSEFFLADISHYCALSIPDLLHATKSCLQNLERLNDDPTLPDMNLRAILIPELWERLQPGTRDMLRRLTSTIAEYNPTQNSFWRKSPLWSGARETAMQEAAHQIRQRMIQIARIDTEALIEQIRFTIAGSRAAANWGPTTCVYEPGFTYRLVPALAHRLRTQQQGRDT